MMDYGKVILEATLELKTGLHIGGSDVFAAIGATDSPVIKDELTGMPIIPGSSIKGKLRTLLAKEKNTSVVEHSEDCDEIKRLFGSTNQISRLQFNDLFFNTESEEQLENADIDGGTEVKFENTIDRRDSSAMPRQIERVVRGAKFDFKCSYEIIKNDDFNDVSGDFSLIKKAFELLENDYLGGSGTRGYGRVKFSNWKIKCYPDELLTDEQKNQLNFNN